MVILGIGRSGQATERIDSPQRPIESVIEKREMLFRLRVLLKGEIECGSCVATEFGVVTGDAVEAEGNERAPKKLEPVGGIVIHVERIAQSDRSLR